MKKSTLVILISLMALCGLTTNAHAIVVTPLTGNISGFSFVDATGTQADPIIINETITGTSFADLQFSQRGSGNPGGSGHAWGRWFRKVVTNGTGSAWTSFEHELQVTLGIPSPDGDGLSFAQGFSPRPFSSDLLPSWTEEILDKDFVNFFNGSVDPGETVLFNFYVTDNVNRDTFYLRQRPNEPVPGHPVVPEPATLSLLGFGLLGLFGFRKKA